MPDPGDRTSKEREAARLERERRRAARPDDEPLLTRVDGRADAESQPPLHEPAYELVGPPEERDAPEERDGPEGWDAPDGLEFDDDPDVPSGTKRVSRRQRLGAAAASTQGRAARRTQRRTQSRTQSRTPTRTRPVSRGRRRAGRVFSLVALVLAAAVIWFLVELFQPFHGSGNGSVTVVIPAKATSSQIGDLLARQGVISSGFFFELRATIAGDRSKLRSGTFHLKRDMTYGDVLKVLTTAPPAAKVTNVTLIEGLTLRQIDALLRSQHVAGSYLAAIRHSKLLRPAQYGAPHGDASLEGFLFPDTYQLREPLSVNALVSDQLRTFRQQFGRVNLSYARSKHLTPYDVLVIASIVQKEAGISHDFPLVASVVYNRLAQHIPLGMDSTTRYEFNDYNKPLTQSQLSTNSPYNTRLHAGLPPTPIDNPGLAAIQAAAHPARTNYLYFVVKPCRSGASVFTASFSQFLQYEREYEAARAQHGGRSPLHC